MDLKELQKNWDEFGRVDPLVSIFRPNQKGKQWAPEEFFQLGREEVISLMGEIESLGFRLSRARALDFGCGAGRITQALPPYFDEVYGVDIAPSMIDLAKGYNRYPDQCFYILNETDDLRLFPENHFSFIYSNITLQHMEPRYIRDYLKEFLRILVPTGLLVFQLPSERKIKPENRSLGRRIKRFLRPMTPKILLNAYYRFKGIEIEEEPVGGPKMEMHAIARAEVVSFLEAEGARLLRITENQNSGPHWISLRYGVTKDR